MFAPGVLSAGGLLMGATIAARCGIPALAGRASVSRQDGGVLEETGRRASIRERLEEVSYRFLNRSEGVEVDKRVVYFLMEDGGEPVKQRDAEMQRVYWCSLAEADRRLSFETERRMVRRAARRLAEIDGDAG